MKKGEIVVTAYYTDSEIDRILAVATKAKDSIGGIRETLQSLQVEFDDGIINSERISEKMQALRHHLASLESRMSDVKKAIMPPEPGEGDTVILVDLENCPTVE